MRHVSLAVVVLSLFVAACAAGSGSGDSGPRRSSNLITLAELTELTDVDTAFEAIRRLHPNWLTGRGGSPARVFIDGVEMGGTNILQSYRVTGIQECRFVSPSDATMRFGTGFGGGVIEVTTR